MTDRAPPVVLRYGLAVACTAAAVLLRWGLDPWLGNEFPFSTLYGAIAVAVWYGGAPPALLAAALGYVACAFLFVEPRRSFSHETFHQFLGLSAYLLSCGIIIGFGVGMRSALGRAEASRQQALDQQALLEAEAAERHETAVRLRDAHGRIRTILESITEAFFVLDGEWRITHLNPPAEALFGQPRAALLGRELWEVSPEAAGTTAEEFRTAVVSRKPALFETHWQGDRWLEIRAYPSAEGLSVFVRDVTERTRVERSLAESEERFARFMQYLPGLAWIKDEQGRYAFVNDAAERAFGRSRGEVHGKTDHDLFPPETAGVFREHDRRALATGGGIQVIETLDYPDGTAHHSQVCKFPIPGPDGRGVLVGGMAVDITDLRRAEEDARTNGERFRFLAEAGSLLASALDYEATLAAVAQLVVPQLADWCSVYVTEPDGRLRPLAVAHADPSRVEWARELSRRYPPDPDSPRGIAAVARTGRPELVPELTDELLAAGARDSDHLAILRGLGLRSVMMVPLTARGRSFGAITFVGAESGRRYGPDDLAFAQELARRAGLAVDNARLFRESQEALRLLGVLIEASGLLTCSLDPPAVRAAILDLSHRLVEADAYAIWRHDPETDEWAVADSAGLSDVYIRTAGRIPAGQHAMPEEPIVAEDVTGSDDLSDRQRAYRAEGIAALLVVPLRIHGRVAGTLAFYYRTTRRFDPVTIRVASALADLAGAAIGTSDLFQRESVSRQRAEAADRAKDEFLALLGHELRNPLAPIRNAVEIIRLKGDDPAILTAAREMIARQVTQLGKLVDELLDASRVARGKVRLSVERLDLAGLVRTTAEDHRPSIEAAGLTFAVDVPSYPVRVRADAARLAQVIGNLIHNSQKFTDPGGRVCVRVREDGGEAVLSVTDTGVGINPAALNGLFQAFHQVGTDPARSKGGLGLGLSVVKGLVELHGGRVEAESDGDGHGTTFTVRLPLDLDPTRPPVPVHASGNGTTTRGDGRRVLVIEDGADTADSLRLVLELRGFEVSVARTGADGVELARRLQPHAVVCDLGLPGMTGYEVARALRKQPETADSVLVAVSGYGQDEDRRKAREAGFDDLRTKPADVDGLVRLLTGEPARG